VGPRPVLGADALDLPLRAEVGARAADDRVRELRARLDLAERGRHGDEPAEHDRVPLAEVDDRRPEAHFAEGAVGGQGDNLVVADDRPRPAALGADRRDPRVQVARARAAVAVEVVERDLERLLVEDERDFVLRVRGSGDDERGTEEGDRENAAQEQRHEGSPSCRPIR